MNDRALASIRHRDHRDLDIGTEQQVGDHGRPGWRILRPERLVGVVHHLEVAR